MKALLTATAGYGSVQAQGLDDMVGDVRPNFSIFGGGVSEVWTVLLGVAIAVLMAATLFSVVNAIFKMRAAEDDDPQTHRSAKKQLITSLIVLAVLASFGTIMAVYIGLVTLS